MYSISLLRLDERENVYDLINELEYVAKIIRRTSLDRIDSESLYFAASHVDHGSRYDGCNHAIYPAAGALSPQLRRRSLMSTRKIPR